MLKNLNLGIDIGEKKLSILLYADDIVLMSESEDNWQKILDYCHKWCKKWMLKINEINLISFPSGKLENLVLYFNFNVVIAI